MPFETPSQYIESADEFAAHWASVNAALGATPLILRGSYALATFATDRTALQTAITAVQITDNTLQNAAGDRDIKKNAIKERIGSSAQRCRGNLAARPTLPHCLNCLPRTPHRENGLTRLTTWRGFG